jgi:hypothetical protein
MEVTMLLCDAAQAVGNKLYILGGGWSQIVRPDVPVPMAIAVKLAIPWDRANEVHHFRLYLITADGEPVMNPSNEEEAIAVEGDLEVGRPPGLAQGTSLDSVFAVAFNGLPLPADGYVWELEIGGEVHGRIPFRVGPPKRRS